MNKVRRKFVIYAMAAVLVLLTVLLLLRISHGELHLIPGRLLWNSGGLHPAAGAESGARLHRCAAIGTILIAHSHSSFLNGT